MHGVRKEGGLECSIVAAPAQGAYARIGVRIGGPPAIPAQLAPAMGYNQAARFDIAQGGAGGSTELSFQPRYISREHVPGADKLDGRRPAMGVSGGKQNAGERNAGLRCDASAQAIGQLLIQGKQIGVQPSELFGAVFKIQGANP